MARITVKDLPQSDTLDRQAMLAIKGGSRGAARPIVPPTQASSRVVEYPPGFGARTPAAPQGRA